MRGAHGTLTPAGGWLRISGSLMDELRPAPSQTILVVDDDAMQVSAISHFLEREGFKPVGAGSGPEALRYFETGSCDLILLDVNMPGMDGFEVCKRLRSSEKAKKIPIVFLTARAGARDYRNGVKSGGDTYVTKPFRNNQLLNIINALLTLHRK